MRDNSSRWDQPIFWLRQFSRRLPSCKPYHAMADGSCNRRSGFSTLPPFMARLTKMLCASVTRKAVELLPLAEHGIREAPPVSQIVGDRSHCERCGLKVSYPERALSTHDMSVLPVRSLSTSSQCKHLPVLPFPNLSLRHCFLIVI